MSKQINFALSDRIITAWFSHEECSEVCFGLFSPFQSKRNSSLGALCAWAARLGNKLPVAIECTYSLMVSHRDLLNNNVRSSAAVSRAANAITRALFLLTERQQHQRAPFQSESNARTPLPLHVLAEELGVPEWVVEIRHDSVHGRLPSRALLLRATELLIDAVRLNYWDALKQHWDSSSDLQSPLSGDRVSFIQAAHQVLNRLLESVRQSPEDASSQPPTSKRSRKELSDLHSDWRALVKQSAHTRHEADLFACLLAPEYSALIIEPLSSSPDASDSEPQRDFCQQVLETLASQQLLAAFWRDAFDALVQLCHSSSGSSRSQLAAQSLAGALTRALRICCGSVSSGFEKRLRERVFTSDALRQLAVAGAERVVRAVAALGARAAPDATGRALISLLETLLQCPCPEADVQLAPLAKKRLLDACRVFLGLVAEADSETRAERPLDESALREWLAPESRNAAAADASASAPAASVWQRDRSGIDWAHFALGTCPSLRAPADFAQLVLCATDSADDEEEDDCVREESAELQSGLRESEVRRPIERRRREAEPPVDRDFIRRVDDAICILPT